MVSPGSKSSRFSLLPLGSNGSVTQWCLLRLEVSLRKAVNTKAVNYVHVTVSLAVAIDQHQEYKGLSMACKFKADLIFTLRFCIHTHTLDCKLIQCFVLSSRLGIVLPILGFGHTNYNGIVIMAWP